MTPCHVVGIVTPRKFILRGLWFGPKRPKRAYVWMHGLGSSMFSKLSIVERLTDGSTAVLVFNNRGHDKVSRLARADEKKIGKTRLGGAAHEVFTDCVDDIDGAVRFAKRQGAKEVFLIGHSTGCQKSVYWAAKRRSRGVKGMILMAPVSDWAAELKLQGKRKLERATRIARELVKRGRKHALLPDGVWHELLDAQRFLSLYTPESVEEIFTYAQTEKKARMLKSVQKPILVLWAEKDEFSAHPAQDVALWFKQNLTRGAVHIIPRVGHGFKGGEARAVRKIRRFIKG